jgi:copper resistance protein B
MNRIIVFALLSGTLSMPAAAQDPHAGHAMPPPTPNPPAAAADDAVAEAPTGLEQPVGDAPPPAVILDSAADRVYGTPAMDRAREVLADEHGGTLTTKLMANIFEYATAGEGGYRWDLEGWYGGDLHRLVFKTEGEGFDGDGAKRAEMQALYSRPVGRYTDAQFGLRYDFEPDSRAYATIAVESLLPYWFRMEAAFFISDRGDVLGRLEGSYDLRLTQRLVLQPRIELQLAAQDIPEAGTGSGVSSGELGLRLRYDIRREFAPYIGWNFERAFGQTADFARLAGEDDKESSFVVGLRAWF